MAITITEKNSAFGQRIKTVAINNNGVFMESIVFMEGVRGHFNETVKKSVMVHKLLKVCAVLKASFIKETVNGDVEQKTFYFRTPPKEISAADNLNEWYADNVVEVLKTKLTEFEKEGNY